MKLTSLIYFYPTLIENARKWAGRLSLECVDGSAVSASARARQIFVRDQCAGRGAAFALVLGKEGLALHAIDLNGEILSISADFHGATTTYRRKQGGGKSQMIARAVGVKSGICPYVLDATAGLGKDAFVLASLGCRVMLLERDLVIHALLEDAMERARQFGASEDPDLLKILDRMELIQGDAWNYMCKHSAKKRPDVVYLDPMFPPRKKSAQVKKEMQVFHQLIGTDKDADALLKPALKLARHRVVVKRPRIAPALSCPEPSYTLEGKRNRFDVYALQKVS